MHFLQFDIKLMESIGYLVWFVAEYPLTFNGTVEIRSHGQH